MLQTASIKPLARLRAIRLSRITVAVLGLRLLHCGHFRSFT